MPFTRPSLQTIIDRVGTDITSRLTGGVALLRVSLLRILGKVFSGAVHTAYGALDYISINILPDLSEGAWLDRHGIMWGVVRLKAAFASAINGIKITGVNGTFIPLGTVFVRDDGLEYETTDNGTIACGILTVDVSAVAGGADYDTSIGIFFTISSPISGADDTAEIVIAIEGGTDRETDSAYRVRILFRIQNPPAGGAERDYVSVGNSVAGVQQTFVWGAQNLLVAEPGHVTCVILGVSPKIPGDPIIAAVESALTDSDTGIVPVDIEENGGLHVVKIIEADIEVFISIPDYPDTTVLEADIDAAITQLFTDDGAPGGTILLSRLRNAIATAGPDDYEITDIEVNAGSIGVVDIALSDYDYPINIGSTFALLT